MIAPIPESCDYRDQSEYRPLQQVKRIDYPDSEIQCRNVFGDRKVRFLLLYQNR